MMKQSLSVKIILCLLSILVTSCAGQQIGGSGASIQIDYLVNQEKFNLPENKIIITVVDERFDKDIMGDGASPNAVTDVAGFLSFGVFYAFAPKTAVFEGQGDLVTTFKQAFYKRLSLNGMTVIDGEDDSIPTVKISIHHFLLDFKLGTWTGEVGYISELTGGSNSICRQIVYRKEKKFNMYGFSSGEEALSKAFNDAINELDFNVCF